MKFQFTVPGLPRPKQRPRLGRHGNVYTPRQTRSYETEIWTMALGAGLRQNCFRDRSVAVKIIAMMGPATHDLLKVDLDNIVKVVLDALRPAFNDAYVIRIEATKMCLRDPYVTVAVEDL